MSGPGGHAKSGRGQGGSPDPGVTQVFVAQLRTDVDRLRLPGRRTKGRDPHLRAECPEHQILELLSVPHMRGQGAG
jgi:hypothetical protein